MFKTEPGFHDADGLLRLTFRFSVLKVHFHWFPVLPVSANPLCLECRAAAILQVCFKSSFPSVSGFTGYGLALRVEHRAAAIHHADFSSENTSVRKFSFLKNK